MRRSDLSDRGVELEGTCGRPLAVRREEFVGRVFDRRCDHERVRESQPSVPSTKRCGSARDSTIQIDDLDRQPVDEVVNHGDCSLSSTLRADKTFGERGRGHCQSIPGADDACERRVCRHVVGVVGVEQADDDPGVDVDQPHSSRRVSTLCWA